MKYGHFDDENREYVITTPKTPYPWINYLGTTEFFSLISNTSGGYSFFKDARLRRLTRYRYNNVPLDNNGKYFFIKDGDTIWNPGWQPVQAELDSYECRHGFGYTKFNSSKNGIVANVLNFVPVDEHCEVALVTLKNDTTAKKQIKLFSFVEWCLYNAQDDCTNFQRNFSTGEVEIEGDGKTFAIYHKTEYRERRDHFAFYSVNSNVAGFDTDRESFLGTYNGFEKADVLVSGKSKNSVADGWSPIASHALDVALDAGEEKSYVFVLGYIENDEKDKWDTSSGSTGSPTKVSAVAEALEALVTVPFFAQTNPKAGVINKTEAKRIQEKFSTKEKVLAALKMLNEHWDKLLSTFVLKTDDEKLNRQSIWNQYQCVTTYNFARSASYFESGIGRGIGFRDTSQDLLGSSHLISQERLRERMYDVAATQFKDGSAYHQFQPLTKKGNADIGSNFNDDPLWLIMGVSGYIKESGDKDFLKVQVPFDNNENDTATMFEHLKRSYNYTINNKGPHGLPLIGRADWNDCLNLNCFSTDPNDSFQTCTNAEGKNAESVMVAQMFVFVTPDYIKLCEIMGDEAEAKKAAAECKKMEDAICDKGWDGEWYLRAYDDAGNKVGSKECEEGQIFIETQGFGTMAKIGKDKGYPEKSLDSTKKYLDSKYGICILYPAYSKYHVELGEVSSYPQGYKENGGIFCHNNPWVIIGEAVNGRADDAFNHYTKIAPAYIEEISDIHKTEPYVYCQMVAGKEARNFGQGKNSWLTGTASWNFIALSQYIAGVKPDFDGLKIEPHLPSCIKEATVTRIFRGVKYNITIKNEKTDGTPKITADAGVKINGTTVDAAGKKEVNVTVVME